MENFPHFVFDWPPHSTDGAKDVTRHSECDPGSDDHLAWELENSEMYPAASEPALEMAAFFSQFRDPTGREAASHYPSGRELVSLFRQFRAGCDHQRRLATESEVEAALAG